jgi:hypothetical protein
MSDRMLGLGVKRVKGNNRKLKKAAKHDIDGK